VKYSGYLRDDKLAIFLLHGVVRKSDYRIRNYTRKHIELDYFDAVLKDLTARGTGVSLDHYLDFLCGERDMPSRPFAVRFDDGFENNFTEAVPIMKRHGIPANFYVTSSFIDENGMSWIDQIELCLECFCPRQLIMPWRKEPYYFGNVELEKRFLDDVRRHVKGNKDLVPSKIVLEIYGQCGEEVITSSDDPLDKKMTWEQVSELASDPLFTIGGHTHTHPILGHLNSARMKVEIETPAEMLKSKAGITEVRHFSYPEGFEGSFTKETIELLKACGVVCSPTAIEGVNELDADPFHLRRIFIV
jgi:peptidoglycan/xylan/chitin deacetylase (PgdA/CDA1 family)